MSWGSAEQGYQGAWDLLSEGTTELGFSWASLKQIENQHTHKAFTKLH